MANRNLPRRYAEEFMKRTRSRLFSKSFGWNEFLSVMEQKETTSLRAYTSLRLSKLGMPQKDEILASLKNAGLLATEDNATAMMHYLNASYEESKSYAHFRSFVMLLPSNHLPGNPRHGSDDNFAFLVKFIFDWFLFCYGLWLKYALRLSTEETAPQELMLLIPLELKYKEIVFSKQHWLEGFHVHSLRF